MTDRADLVRAIGDALGPRRLVWAGARADDAEPLCDLPNFDASYSTVGASRPLLQGRGISYEELAGRRPDLLTWDMQRHVGSDAGAAFRQALLGALGAPSALVPHRATPFVSSVAFARRDSCILLGLLGPHQTMFEHKPWVETALADLPLDRIEWAYVADEDGHRARALLRGGPAMLRPSRGSGGVGLVRVDDPGQLASAWPHGDERFVSVARFVDGALPVNVGAVCWCDGVTVHAPSVQLIGVPSCLDRPFGYCGNDFVAARAIDADIVDRIERAVVRIGSRLRRYGYLGTFGVDFLVHEGRALFVELNARFQGSSRASAQISRALGTSCIHLEHVAATLGLPAPRSMPLRRVVAEAPPLAQFFVHHTGEAGRVDAASLVRALRDLLPDADADIVVDAATLVEPAGVVARIATDRSITSTGFDLDPALGSIVDAWRRAAT